MSFVCEGYQGEASELLKADLQSPPTMPFFRVISVSPVDVRLFCLLLSPDVMQGGGYCIRFVERDACTTGQLKRQHHQQQPSSAEWWLRHAGAHHVWHYG